MPRLIKKMAMVIAGTLMVQSSLSVTSVYAHETTPIVAQSTKITKTTSATGDIATTIRFDYPITYKKVKEQNIKVVLKKDGNSIVEIQPGMTQEILKNKGNYKIKVTPKNTENIERTTEDVIGFYDISIEGLELGEYQLTYEGEGYKTYTSNKIILDKYSKNVIVGTADQTFSYGDMTGDQEINEKDLEAMEQAIKEENKEFDLNGDDKVDIVDLTYIKQQIAAKGEEIQVDLAAIIKEDILQAAEASLKEVGLKLAEGNSVVDLFNSEKSVTIQKDSDSDKLLIPLDLGDGIEAQIVELSSPLGKGGIEEGTVLIEYIEDGITKTKEEKIITSTEGMHLLSRAQEENKIVINLGKRVPVKCITISVDKVLEEDGSPSYVVMEEVSFVKDIVTNISPVDKTAIKNVVVTEKDEEIVLEWDSVPNVEGYRVFYSETPGKYTEYVNVDKPYASIKGLKNLKTYYFTVRATSGDWMGTASPECSGIPQPSAPPLKPDSLSVQKMNGALRLTWKASENATYYKVFYKESKAANTAYKQFIPEGSSEGKITSLSASIGGLTNGVDYDLYVIAGNKIGESQPSNIAVGKPERLDIVGPVLPTQNRIGVDQIKNIKLLISNNIDMNFYPNGFNLEYNLEDTKDGIKNVVDNDYSTHWTASDWRVSGRIDFEFNSPQEMNYVIFVPRVDEEKYIKTLTRYHITVWEQGDDLNGPGKEIVTDKACKVRTDENGRKYMVFEFPKTTVIKIGVRGRMADGGPALHSASEIAFYKYDSLEDDIRKLFGDNAFTSLASGVTEQQIDAIKAKLQSKDAYYVDSEIYLDELALAEALLAQNTNKLGIIKDQLISIDTSKDPKTINDWSPLGIVGYAGKKMVVYADIPKDETVELIPTQYYAESDSLTGNTIQLIPGRNIIDITKIGSLKNTAGGAFYYRYSGKNGNQIKLHIRAVDNSIVKIPTLELYNWSSLSEKDRETKIKQYIKDLTDYNPKALCDKDTNPANSTEISGRNILLSLPADQVLKGLEDVGSTLEEQTQKLYDSMEAWEEVAKVVHTTYGLDDPLNVFKSRQNIRYMQMFGKAFMYAAGNHIGVGYESTSALVQGKPTSLLQSTSKENALFGWGIGHEIGHNMDRLGKAEITNNIYSLMLQTYDGKDNTLQSRLELSNKYEEIYKKVAVGDKGMANDVFTQLGMYWQLHLAYDNGQKDTENGPLSFYNKLFKVYDSGAVSQFSGDDQFAVAASKVVNKNLTEFFTKWGVDLSDSAKKAMAEIKDVESRKIQYLTDASRRYRLNGGKGIEKMDFTATATVLKDLSASGSKATTGATDDNTVKITINYDKEKYKDGLLGFEIFRDGKQIAFITGTTYEDVLGSANNKAFKYDVRAIDALGNIIAKKEDGTTILDGKVSAGEVRIEHDNVISKDLYDIEFINGNVAPEITTESAIKITFKKQMPVTGIRVKAKTGNVLPTGTFAIDVKRSDEEKYVTAKLGDFTENAAVDKSKFITYFNKPGVISNDTRIWTYDAYTICITGKNINENFLKTFDVEPLSYPGDNVAFEDYKAGKLGQDYVYEAQVGKETVQQVIKAGTLVVVGSYRGDPIYNTIHIVGKYAEHSGLDDKITYVEREVAGKVLMFAEVPEDGETSDISDGLFLFIPDIQKEQELQEECLHVSVLPTEIMAKMYRYDNVNNKGDYRVTSTTLWYTTPSYDSMPEIILNQG